MPQTLFKILVLSLIIIGEAVMIYAEMSGAKEHFATAQTFWQIFLRMLIFIVIGGGFLISGYILGINAFKNIWVMSVVSITSIIILEPILGWTFFAQLPTTGAVIGFVLGVIGLFAAIFF
ncbi:MAG TPA: hypothetical protein PLV72_00870 [Candidatus Magasanikbacteria bacterium]|nr:hypothetical protein [Candidatus Magasanikbacteria bacterium]